MKGKTTWILDLFHLSVHEHMWQTFLGSDLKEENCLTLSEFSEGGQKTCCETLVMYVTIHKRQFVPSVGVSDYYVCIDGGSIL